MFKKILIASAILSATSGIALATPAPYVGASLGFQTNTASKVDTVAANYTGFPVNLFAGYGGVVSQSFYLAGELTGTVGTFSSSSTNNSIRTTYGFGASLIPGVMMSDRTLSFARFGAVRTRFNNKNTTVTGGQVGLGMQTSLTQNIALRGEYDYTMYRSFSNVSKPHAGEASVGVVYSFE